jgi:hypothetical protein
MSDELIEQLMYDYMVNVTVLSMKSDMAAKDGIKIIKNLLLEAQKSELTNIIGGYHKGGLQFAANDPVYLYIKKRLAELQEMLK